MAGKNILLIEPGYKNKYPPLGLMKIAAYHGSHGRNDNVKFIKGEADRSVLSVAWDRIYVTTLFSFEWKTIARSIDFALRASHNQPNRIFVGGIAASLMHEAFLAEAGWRGIRFIKGLLSEAPAISLQLDDFSEELYSDDRSGTPIEDLIPDYSIIPQIESQYQYPVNDAYFAYASRGCVRKCHFCGVPKLEGAQRDAQSITQVVNGIKARYGEKKDLTLMDNNVVASANFKNIIAEIRDLGFHKDATIKRGRVPVKRRVDFNQGVDARILCKDEMYLREMSTVCIKPLRIAFDHIGVRQPYEKAIRYANQFGLNDLSNYMLYNFHDTPEDLYERMELNIDLNEKLGTKIFSFPMRYQPTDLKDRSHVGRHWNRYYLRSMQIILQATHGIVSGAPDFFRRAFGHSAEEFEILLSRPEKYIFNRAYFEELDGKSEFEEFKKEFGKLSGPDRRELLALLSSEKPSQFKTLRGKTANSAVKSILEWYEPLKEKKEQAIWRKARRVRENAKAAQADLPLDEIVEDAGLAEVA
ncbi:MAG: hypothetical protein QOD26_2648 [Betaproteobacteria bacterium]|jgi:hypothetical protein|nr:hypothetical protein [Betaproteobacteria bacterium]